MSNSTSVTIGIPTRRSFCGMELLRQVRHYASEFQRTPWDFAVEIAAFRRGGLTDNDLRWLVLNGYVEHARELPATNGKTRQFCQFGSLTFSRRSCFVPTNAGSQLAEMGTGNNGHKQDDDDTASDPPCTGSRLSSRPTWDAVHQQLRLGHEIVKSFKHPSVSQTVILSAFEEANWPARIDDPLPHSGLLSPQVHLQEAIDCLNRNQQKPLIHFAHDESGRGIIWQYSNQELC